MSLRIVDAITDGLQRTFARNGLVLLAATYVVLTLPNLFLPVEMGAELDAEEPTGSPLIGDSEALGFALSIVSLVALFYLAVVAYRTFVGDETETIPGEALRERPVWTAANVLIGAVAFWLVFPIGLVLFVVPGLFLLVTLWFYGVFVAVDHDNFVTAMRRSWSLTSGNRLQLFGLGFIVFVLSVAVWLAFAILGGFGGDVGAALIGPVGSAFGLVFVWATTARAFTQLQERDQPPEDSRQPTAETF